MSIKKKVDNPCFELLAGGDETGLLHRGPLLATTRQNAKINNTTTQQHKTKPYTSKHTSTVVTKRSQEEENIRASII